MTSLERFYVFRNKNVARPYHYQGLWAHTPSVGKMFSSYQQGPCDPPHGQTCVIEQLVVFIEQLGLLNTTVVFINTTFVFNKPSCVY